MASHEQNLNSNEISAHLDKLFLSYDNFSSNFWHLEDFCVFFNTYLAISQEPTAPIGLKFFVRTGFGHRLPQTKLQPLRLKDAEDIGWCGLSAQIGI